MICNKITIPEFTKEQVAECQNCKHASAKKIWCSHFGVSIIEKGKVLVPCRKIKYPSIGKMAGSFIKESAKYLAAGRPKRTETEQDKCKAICQGCVSYIEDTRFGPRCSKCGCRMNLKKRWSTSHCPEGKW